MTISHMNSYGCKQKIPYKNVFMNLIIQKLNKGISALNKIKLLIKIILNVISPAYRVSTRNEVQLGSINKRLQRIEKEACLKYNQI